MGVSRPRAWLPLDVGRKGGQGKWAVLIDDTVVDSDHDLCACLVRVRLRHPGAEPVVVKLALPSPGRDPRGTRGRER